MLGWIMRMLKRRPRPLEDAERYRKALYKANAALPDDPTLRRVIAEYERAELAMRSARG